MSQQALITKFSQRWMDGTVPLWEMLRILTLLQLFTNLICAHWLRGHQWSCNWWRSTRSWGKSSCWWQRWSIAAPLGWHHSATCPAGGLPRHHPHWSWRCRFGHSCHQLRLSQSQKHNQPTIGDETPNPCHIANNHPWGSHFRNFPMCHSGRRSQPLSLWSFCCKLGLNVSFKYIIMDRWFVVYPKTGETCLTREYWEEFIIWFVIEIEKVCIFKCQFKG